MERIIARERRGDDARSDAASAPANTASTTISALDALLGTPDAPEPDDAPSSSTSSDPAPEVESPASVSRGELLGTVRGALIPPGKGKAAARGGKGKGKALTKATERDGVSRLLYRAELSLMEITLYLSLAQALPGRFPDAREAEVGRSLVCALCTRLLQAGLTRDKPTRQADVKNVEPTG